MQFIDHDAVQQLLTTKSKPAVTIYMPTLTTASPPHITENQIRFKNLINQAIAQVAEHDKTGQLAKQLQALHDNYREDMSFWESQTPGLLICANPEAIQLFHLPIDTEEYIAVDDNFHLAPVIALCSDQREFYVLSVAQQQPRLYKGDMYGLAESDIELPVDASKALGIDEPNQKSENQGSASGPSTNNASFNGRGSARNPQDQDRIRFFRLINKVVTDKLDRTTPLILAGVESDVAEFRSVATHPTILQASIGGNHNGDKAQDLFKQAYQIAWKELVVPEHQAAIEDYQQVHGTSPERTAEGCKSVLAAAEQGRVDKLLTHLTVDTSDTVQDAVTAVPRITFPEPERSKLVNKLAMLVYQMSGKVINLLPAEMPHDDLVVARLRY